MSSSLAEELECAAEEVPDSVFLRTRHGDVTYAQMHELVLSCEQSLYGQGVRAGDTVALMMSNSAQQVAIWFALNGMRAVHAPLNTTLSGERLQHALTVSRAQLVVIDEQYGELIQPSLNCRAVPADSLHPDQGQLTARARRQTATSDELDLATLLFTSGTTGVSKACALSHRYLVRQGQLHAKYFELSSADVLYCPFPLFHIDAATLTVSAALSVRGTAALGQRFSVSAFWEEVQAFDATVFNFMGATLSLLWKQQPRAEDTDHRVRLAWGVPMPEWKDGFEERFGLRLLQVYGSTDAGVPVYDPLDCPQRAGAAGRIIEEYDVRIEPRDSVREDSPGVGEILVRARVPGLTMSEYFDMPEATAGTIVDGWVHTGDLGSLDADGFLSFHGRLSDSIRRRGENISAHEVEQIVVSHADILEAAAVGVPSELSEEEVMVFVVAREAAELSSEQVREHCLRHGPAYMAPRYVALVDRLPKTPTQKVEKFKLRTIGPDASTFDAEAKTPAS